MLDEIREEQQKNKQPKQIIDNLLKQSTATFSSSRSPYVLVNGLLYKIRKTIKNQDHRVIRNKYLLVITTSMQDKLITCIQICTTLHCLPTIQIQQPANVNANEDALSDRTMAHHISIDIMEQFSITKRQKQFLLVIVDYFTRLVELFPLQTTMADIIANVNIDEVFCRYGMPTFILSNNGPECIADLFTETRKALCIRRKLTAAYHAQTNMTERVNRTLKLQIRIYAQQNHQLWDEEIQKLALTIRTSVNETIRETHVFLNFG
ncbi:unnamed protein product [Rotaria magnacalcarata]